MTVDTKDLVTTVAYMVGVPKEHLEISYRESCGTLLDVLYGNKEATIVRCLCRLRTVLFKRFKATDTEMRYNLKNIYSLEWFDQDDIKTLTKWDIPIIKANSSSEKYMNLFNDLISQHIESCRNLFYDWVKWEYIKNLFVIPGYKRNAVMKLEQKKFMENLNCYPYHCYIYFEPHEIGNIFYNDGKFLMELYGQNGDSFTDRSKYKDAHEETKDTIYSFIRSSSKVSVVVDCENSDVFKLYAVLKNLDQDELDKIEKIILYDDAHTTCAWDYLGMFTCIPVEHIEVERVTKTKSLVDVKLTAGVCNAFYRENVTSFILLSSDSDFWGLISALPEASFLVMYEYAKCGQAIKDALETIDVFHCSLDDFRTDNTQEFKTFVLTQSLRSQFAGIVGFTGYDIMHKVFADTRIFATQKEQEAFYNKYIKKLRIYFDSKGNLVMDIPD